MLLVIFIGLLQNFVSFTNAECNASTFNKQKSKDQRITLLHHITEFGKRDQIQVNDCKNKTLTNNKTSSKSPPRLGLHGFLHVRLQKEKQETATRKEDEPFVTDALIIKQPDKERGGIKRTEEEQKQLRKLKLRAETIKMLRKVVDKYFPGGNLTVDQKIKALKILGKLIKLKKEGKIADVKAILNSFPGKTHNVFKSGERVGDPVFNNATKDKVKESGGEVSKNDEDDDSGHGGDIYATIANGPDMPKLPPAVNGKGLEHAHSNIMPVGFQPMANAGELMNSISHPNDISDQVNYFPSQRTENSWSQYSNGHSPRTSLGMGQIYTTGNSYYRDKPVLGDMSMINGPTDARSRMPFSPRYNHRGSYDDEDSYDEEDEDDDDDANEDDNDGDDEDELGRARSYVHRHDYDDDSDDDDVVDYRSRLNRKDNIAKGPKKGNTTLESKGENAKMLSQN